MKTERLRRSICVLTAWQRAREAYDHARAHPGNEKANALCPQRIPAIAPKNERRVATAHEHQPEKWPKSKAEAMTLVTVRPRAGAAGMRGSRSKCALAPGS